MPRHARASRPSPPPAPLDAACRAGASPARRQTAGRPLVRERSRAGGKSGLHGTTVPVNDRRGRPQGKCHREQTARTPQGLRARVKRWGKSPPRFRQRRRHGKPHREQGRIGVDGEARRRVVAGAVPPFRPGWPREARSDAGSRGMAVRVLRGATEPGLQAVWRHSPRKTLAFLHQPIQAPASTAGNISVFRATGPRGNFLSPLLSQIFPCYPMSSRKDPSALGGASGVSIGMVGRAGGVGGPRRPLIRNG